jgi:hypothetical protein
MRLAAMKFRISPAAAAVFLAAGLFTSGLRAASSPAAIPGTHDASLTAKTNPATRRFPEPALALPVYDNNGRSAGLAMVSLVASPEGRMTQGRPGWS